MEPLKPPRPMFIDLDSRASSPAGSSRPVSIDRIQHYAGDVPPALSPLDAFAAHSRRLAKELEETTKAGQRRVSRLPHDVVTKSLNEHQANRPHYFRSLSASSSPGASPGGQDCESVGNSPEVANPKTRPTSEYPRISRVLELKDDDEDGDREEAFVTPRELPTSGLHQTSTPADYFGIPRAESPEPVDSRETSTQSQLEAPDSKGAPQPSNTRPKSTQSQPDVTFTLSPPNAPFARATNHNRPNEASDDEGTSSNAGSTFSRTRKLSSSSNVSVPHTPVSPFVASHARSPSATSDKSTPGVKSSRSHLNFSRPMSSASMNNLRESPKRQESKGSQLSQPSINSLDLPRTPLSFEEPRPRMSDDGYATSSSYTYSKYPLLPRGRMADRESAVFLGLSTPHFEWQEPLFPSTPPLNATKDNTLPPLSPIVSKRPSADAGPSGRPGTAGLSFELGSETCHSCEKPRRPSTARSASESIMTTASSAPRPSTSHGSSSKPLMLPPMPAITRDKQSVSSRSNSTIRPHTARTESNYQSLSADEHVSKAIDLHQHGDLKESTYHLRIAAKQDHPTAMLLYALACRHGWGMRPNPSEGVQWLRKAMDSAMLEVADDENPASETARMTDVNQKKAHRAQFALSIYELGVSHLNGWGTEQDKTLALRCFEIAGEWGDADALTEAGFCYAEGIGCKKDLRKAAKFYRRAAERGVSMVGNSWIYKDKYNDVEDDGRTSRMSSKSTTTSPKKPRNKSRTRSIFSRKKSFSTPK